MKVITLIQPWATLVAKGAKKIETRSWKTNYRGPLAIHAAAKFPEWERGLCHKPFFRNELGDYDFDPGTLPLGKIIATCDLVHVKEMDEGIVFPACQGYEYGGQLWRLDAKERAFGDYKVGRYMWLLANIQMLDRPIPAKGALGLWNYELGGATWPVSEEIASLTIDNLKRRLPEPPQD